jgi:hypothetical protein
MVATTLKDKLLTVVVIPKEFVAHIMDNRIEHLAMH